MPNITVTSKDGIGSIIDRLQSIIDSGMIATVSIKEIRIDDVGYIHTADPIQLDDLSIISYPAIIEPIISGRRLQFRVYNGSISAYDNYGNKISDVDSERYSSISDIHKDCVVVGICSNSRIEVVDVLEINGKKTSIQEKADFLSTVKLDRVSVCRFTVVSSEEELNAALQAIASCVIICNNAKYIYDSSRMLSVKPGRYNRIDNIYRYRGDVTKIWNKVIRRNTHEYISTPHYKTGSKQLHISEGQLRVFDEHGNVILSGNCGSDLTRDAILFCFIVGDIIYVYDCIYNETSISDLTYEERYKIISNNYEKKFITANNSTYKLVKSDISKVKNIKALDKAYRLYSYYNNSNGIVLIPNCPLQKGNINRYTWLEMKDKIVCSRIGNKRINDGGEQIVVDSVGIDNKQIMFRYSSSDRDELYPLYCNHGGNNVLLLISKDSLDRDATIVDPDILGSTICKPDTLNMVFPQDINSIRFSDRTYGEHRYRYMCSAVYKGIGDNERNIYVAEGGVPIDCTNLRYSKTDIASNDSFIFLDSVVEMYMTCDAGTISIVFDVPNAIMTMSGDIIHTNQLPIFSGDRYSVADVEPTNVIPRKDEPIDIGNGKSVFVDSGFVYFGDDDDIYIESDYIGRHGKYIIKNGEIIYPEDQKASPDIVRERISESAILRHICH